jgi:hypothetical protein
LVAALFSIPYRLPAAVVVEDILAGSVEYGKYVENPLGHLAAKYGIRIYSMCSTNLLLGMRILSSCPDFSNALT